MQIKLEQLQGNLAKGLAPVYFLTGDEVLLMQEAADMIRAAAKNAGYDERQIFHAEGKFDWNSLSHAASEMSLFAQQRIFDLRLPTAKPGKQGGEALRDYCSRIPEDTILLVSAGKLEASAKKSAWVKALDNAGVMVTIWPVNASALPMWIEQRARAKGITMERESVRLIADRVEGNLLAASQEIDKLKLLYGETAISVEDVNRAVADSARFDIFGLVDAALQGNIRRVIRMLNSLRVEGVEEILVLWALAREIRIMANIASDIENGVNIGNAVSAAGVWNNRKQLISAAVRSTSSRRWFSLLARCLKIDKTIKGLEKADPWMQLQELVVLMSRITARKR